MARAVKAPEVAGQKPAIDDGLRREFRFIQVAGHDGSASDGDFANAVRGRMQNAHFHPGQRLADGIRAKRFQIVDGDCCACFRESVSVGDGNAEVVEKLQSLRLRECTSDDDGLQFAAKRLMDLL